MAGALHFGIAIDAAQADDAEDESHRAENAADDGNQAEHAEIVAGQRHAVPIGDDRRDAVVMPAHVGRSPAARTIILLFPIVRRRRRWRLGGSNMFFARRSRRRFRLIAVSVVVALGHRLPSFRRPAYVPGMIGAYEE